MVAREARLEGCAEARGDLAWGDVAALREARRRLDDDVLCNIFVCYSSSPVNFS